MFWFSPGPCSYFTFEHNTIFDSFLVSDVIWRMVVESFFRKCSYKECVFVVEDNSKTGFQVSWAESVEICRPLSPVFLKNFIYFLIEGWLPYRILLFSVQLQHESVIGIYIVPPFWTSLPSSSSSHPSMVDTEPLWVSWVIQQIRVGCLFYIW